MKQTRTGKRREAAINSVKVLLTSASLAATIGGWAAISAVNGSTLEVASTGADATATVQAFLDSRTTTGAASSTPAAVSSDQTTNTTTTNTSYATSANTAATATVAPTATAVPQRVVIQPTIHTRSSR